MKMKWNRTGPWTTFAIIVALIVVLQGCGGHPTDKQPNAQETVSESNTTTAKVAAKKEFPSASNFVSIAVFDGPDTNVQQHVLLVLESASIPCFISGSVGYGLFVPKDLGARATEILREDA